MMIRVHALYERDKRITYLLSTLFIVQLVVSATSLSLLVNTLQVESFAISRACGSSIAVPKWFMIFWLPALLTDIVLLMLTLRRAYAFGDKSDRDLDKSKLVGTLARDQILYFVGFMLVAGVNIPIIAFSPLLICVAFGFVLGFPLVMGCRMFLNLREIADEMEDLDRITLSILVFAPGATAGRSTVVSRPGPSVS